MLQKFITWIRRVFDNMIDSQSLKNLNIDAAMSAEMQRAISLWGDLFLGKAPWLDDTTKSLNLPSSICGELARLVTVELNADVTGGARADYLKAQFTPVLDALRSQSERAIACGGLVLKPYIDDGNIAVDFVSAQNFIPTSFNGRGEITGAVFIEQLQKGKVYYTRIEQHNAGTAYNITNKAFYSTAKDSLGTPIELANVDEWASIEPSVSIKMQNGKALNGTLFAYIKMPFANNIDTSSPLGISAYSSAIGLIEQADAQYSRILWEYEGSELAIDASVGALQVAQGKGKMPKHSKRLFREISVNKKAGEDLYSVFSPNIRDTSLFNGLNELLRHVEFLSYLSYGTLSNPQTVEKTAEEIKMSKQRSYSAVKDIQKSLEVALRKLLYAMDIYTSLYHLAPSGSYEAIFNWGDSIMTDTDKEREQMRQDCRDGVAQWWEYRVKFYGESETDAKARVSDNSVLGE